MSRASLVTALKDGFYDRDIYYRAIENFGEKNYCFFDESLNGYVVTGYEEAIKIIKNKQLFTKPRFNESVIDISENKLFNEGVEIFRKMAVFHSDVDYSKTRKFFNEQLRFNKVKCITEQVEKSSNELLDRIERNKKVAVIENILKKYTSDCASLILFGDIDVPRDISDRALFMANFFDMKRLSKENTIEAIESMKIVSDWISIKLNLSDMKILSDLTLLYLAAHESLTYLINTALVEASKINQPQNNVKKHINESIRVDSPVQIISRHSEVEYRIGSIIIPRRSNIYIHIGAANRDKRVFDSPEEFDIGRRHPHLGYGWGMTHCVGYEYANTCAHIFIKNLFNRFKEVKHHDNEARFDHGFFARGIKESNFTFN